MKTIATFETPEDAHLFRAFLGSRGIPSSVLDENMIQIAWYYSHALGGVRVVLHDDSDLDAALDAYSEYAGALNAEPSRVTEVRGWPLVLLVSWIFGGPMPIFGRRNVVRPAGIAAD